MIDDQHCAVCDKLIKRYYKGVQKYCSAACKTVAQKHADYERKKQANLSAGLCSRCGQSPFENGKIMCRACLDAANDKTKEHQAKLDAEGICRRCQKNKQKTGYKHCEQCATISRAQKARERERCLAAGRCTRCGGKRVRSSGNCEICLLKSTATRHLGNSKNYKLLMRKFLDQNKRCPYSDKLLFIGDNASLDHIIPTSQGGTDHIDNLEWVDKDINTMKGGRSKVQFVEEIRMLHERTKHW